ncbi:PREDICTED: olfactory receptor 56B4-like [Elephantulus edwardii]|uniref:olfactory receptor 56B4-like n=1 Tax=Elephantulus edwardii TaxID=28737 RepID=UPI0003F07474|nr:PREDICTED: olfactory receptor 56B4-like [Elephantulus edwardii]
MATSQSWSNNSGFQVSEFLLLGFPGIYDWQHWLSLPLALLYILALGANLLIMITIGHEATLHQPMYQFLSALAVVDIGLATTIMPKILAIFWLAIPVAVLASQRHYCSRKEIEHCLCSNLGVISLACDDITINRFYQLALAWVVAGSDMGLVFVSYALILCSVLKLKSSKATAKALSTCSSHLILILFFYSAIIVLSLTHLAGRRFPLIPVLLNVLHNVIPPALNPMVYAIRTQELRVGFKKIFGFGDEVSKK